MDMGMVGQLPPPGVQHPEETGQIPADVFFIGCQFLDGLRGGLEQGRIAWALMAADESAELLGHGEGDHEVMPVKLPIHLLCQPLPALMMLAGGAVPVPA